MAAGDILDERDAAHLLRRAGFGAPPREVARFAGRTRGEAVDALLAVKPKATRGPGSHRGSHAALVRLQGWWLRRMLSPRYRLQEKMVLFWHDHFPTSHGVVARPDALAEQNALFRLHALGSFRALVAGVTRDRAMLEYLDGRRSRVGEVNENYARELMELFTLGPADEDGQPNYSQQDVVMLARALTGFHYADSPKPLVALSPERFDAGNKVLFEGRPFEVSGVLGVQHPDGTPFPPETNVLDALFAHRDTRSRPTLARFLVRKLWAWFATPDAGDALVDELSAVFVASGYEIGALVRALLTHDAFYAEEARLSTPKTAVEFATQALLALGVKLPKTLNDYLRPMGMELFGPPGVDGWQHGPAWLSTSRYLARLELADAIVNSRRGIKFKPRVPRDATPEALLDVTLARLGLEVSAATRQRALDALREDEFGSVRWRERSLPGLYLLLLGSPEFQVH